MATPASAAMADIIRKKCGFGIVLKKPPSQPPKSRRGRWWRATRPSSSTAAAPAQSATQRKTDRCKKEFAYGDEHEIADQPEWTGFARGACAVAAAISRLASATQRQPNAILAMRRLAAAQACHAQSRTISGVNTKMKSGFNATNHGVASSPCQKPKSTLRSVKSSAQARWCCLADHRSPRRTRPAADENERQHGTPFNGRQWLLCRRRVPLGKSSAGIARWP